MPILIDEPSRFLESDGLIVHLRGEEERMITGAHVNMMTSLCFELAKDFQELQLSISFALRSRKNDIVADDAHVGQAGIVGTDADGNVVINRNERAASNLGMESDLLFEFAEFPCELGPFCFRQLSFDRCVALQEKTLDRAGWEGGWRRKGEHGSDGIVIHSACHPRSNCHSESSNYHPERSHCHPERSRRMQFNVIVRLRSL